MCNFGLNYFYFLAQRQNLIFSIETDIFNRYLSKLFYYKIQLYLYEELEQENDQEGAAANNFNETKKRYSSFLKKFPWKTYGKVV